MTILAALDGLSGTGQPRRFDLTGALDECKAAAATWATVSAARLMGIATDDDLEEAWMRLRCASAVLNWERGRAVAAFATIPGAPWVTDHNTADYDDDTIAALLRGAR
ncbi:hypothetical protein [Mycolicibacterium wolinskyi]|uniref:hypothetical protein n=1 Tax=Mycolicibacterium wolinskyi TaxID=59750 RepID=UPI0039176EC4